MKKLILPTLFFLPCLMQAQGGIKAFRISVNTFLTNVFADNTEGVHKPDKSIYDVSSGLSLGLAGEILFYASLKLDISTGIGFEFRSYKTTMTNVIFAEGKSGLFTPLVGSVNASFQTNLYIPVNFIYALSQNSTLSICTNPYFRIDDKVDVYATELDGSRRSLYKKTRLQYSSFNINLQAAYTHKIALENNKSLLIKPYLGYLALSDGLFVNYGNNHFWDYGISLGIEFGNGETEEKKGKPKRKRR